MLTDLSHLPVNWIDGMKISRRHFMETEDAVLEQLRDGVAIGLTDYNFGILPAERSFDLAVFCDFSQQINIELNACKAITPDGSRIQILPSDAIRVSRNFKEIAGQFNLQTSQAQILYILLSINPFRRIAAGEPRMDENPPRHPHTRPEYRIDVIPAEQVNKGRLTGSLILGKVLYQNGELLFQKDFIPSCSAVDSCSLLMDRHAGFRRLLDEWEQCCLKIIQKINARTQSQQLIPLAGCILKLSEKMLEQLVLQKLHYHWIVSRSEPVCLCVHLLKNIQYFHMLLQCYTEKDREEMLNYFAEWTEVQAGTLENQAMRALQLPYDHFDMVLLLNEINGVYDSHIQVFRKLSQLDFIGKKKGQNIFVIEQEVKDTRPPTPPPNEKPNGRWSPLS